MLLEIILVFHTMVAVCKNLLHFCLSLNIVRDVGASDRDLSTSRTIFRCLEVCMVKTMCGVLVRGFGRTQASAAASLRLTSLAGHPKKCWHAASTPKSPRPVSMTFMYTSRILSLPQTVSSKTVLDGAILTLRAEWQPTLGFLIALVGATLALTAMQ